MKVSKDDSSEMRTQGSAHLKSTDCICMGKGSINSLLQEQVGTLLKIDMQRE